MNEKAFWDWQGLNEQEIALWLWREKKNPEKMIALIREAGLSEIAAYLEWKYSKKKRGRHSPPVVMSKRERDLFINRLITQTRKDFPGRDIEEIYAGLTMVTNCTVKELRTIRKKARY